MKITLPERLAGTRDALFVLEVEFPVATDERTVVVETTGSIEALDLRGTGPGGTYAVPVGLDRLHIPMRVTGDAEGEAQVRVSCTAGPDSGSTEERTLLLEKGPRAAASGSGGKLAVAAVLVAVLGGAALWLGPKIFGGDKIPDVTGKAEMAAVALLQEAEYLTEIVMQDVDESAKQGVVLRTIPPAGEGLAKGEKVQVVVGNAQAVLVTVSSEVGNTLEAAEAGLRAAGLQPVVQYVDAQPGEEPGRVLRQSPESGSLERGREVELFVARKPAATTPVPPTPVPPTPSDPPEGPKPPTPDQPKPPTPSDPPEGPKPPSNLIRIPAVTEQTVEQAKMLLEDVGLIAITDFEAVEDEPLGGKVIRQFPEATTQVSPGSQVFITVGRFAAPTPDQPKPPTPDQPKPPTPADPPVDPKPPTPADPPVDPKPPTPADPPVDPKPPTPADPPVDPKPPTPADPPTQPAPDGSPVAVPDLIGISRERATGLVRGAGFRYRVHLEETSDVPDGQVLSQRPTAGTMLAEGGTIDVIVARAPTAAGVAVPDVVGRTREEAERLLRAESFLVRTTLGGGSQAQVGRVSAQSPTPGSNRPRRTWVEIVVISGVGPLREPSGGTPPSLPGAGDGETTNPDSSDGLERPPAVGDGAVVTPPPTSKGATPVPPVNLPGKDAPAANTVPSVLNQPITDAIRAVLEAGLIPIVEIDRSGSGTPGNVLRQSPDGAGSVRAGALVRLGVRVQQSTQERYVSLPTALGGLLSKEREAMRATGLSVEVIEVDAPGHPYAGTGRVAAQYPVSSVPRSVARQVTLWIVR